MPSIDPNDFFALDQELNEEHVILRDTVRRLVQQELLPNIRQNFSAGHFPRELIPKLGELGLLGASLDGYGCTDAGGIGYGLINRELERGDSGLRSFVSVQTSLVMYPIHRYGSKAQKQRWFPELAAGRAIGCFGPTEPDHGSDPASLITTAKRDGDSFVLNGAKMWITNGSIADVAVVFAKLDGEMRGFLVEANTPGFSAPEIRHKFSLRASVTSELVFDDCRIPVDNMLPGSVVGIKAPLSCLSQARYGIAWGVVGAATACFDEVRQYTLERKQFAKPLASFQITQVKLADMATAITQAQLMVFRLAQLKDAGQLRPQQISMAKRANVAMALDVARQSRAMLGAAGISLDFASGRHMNNLESVYTYEGTHDIHSLILGQALTGIPAFS